MEGLWYGFALGAGMQTVVLVGLVMTADWDREVRKSRLRIFSLEERLRDETEESLSSVFDIPRPGSRALGGFLFYSKRRETRELK